MVHGGDDNDEEEEEKEKDDAHDDNDDDNEVVDVKRIEKTLIFNVERTMIIVVVTVVYDHDYRK